MAITLGEKIKQLRKERRLSQDSLAQILGVSFQAVSKWETNVTMPDVSLLPSIASFFGVSLDELFDYNVWENEQRIQKICREAAACRLSDPVKAEQILRGGLKQFPANETMLTILVYVLWSIPGRNDDLIATCKTLIECATSDGVRCDVLRILAEAYHRAGKSELVEPTLEQIPEFYFTKKECIARLLDGQKSMEAAHFQMNLSGQSTVEMLRIMARRYDETGDSENAGRCRRIARGILDLFLAEGGQVYEIRGYEWLDDSYDLQ